MKLSIGLKKASVVFVIMMNADSAFGGGLTYSKGSPLINCETQNCDGFRGSTQFALPTLTAQDLDWSAFWPNPIPTSGSIPYQPAGKSPVNFPVCMEIVNRSAYGVFVPLGSPAEMYNFQTSPLVVGPNSRVSVIPCNTCGTDNGAKLTQAPSGSSNLCSAGVESGLTSTKTGWSWTCTDAGQSSSCSATLEGATSCPSQTLSWVEGSASCSAVFPATPSGQTATLSSTASGSGAATFSCSSTGNWSELTGTCNPLSCPGQTLSWQVGSVSCSASAPSTQSNVSATLKSTAGGNGSATFACSSSGHWSASPDAGSTCSKDTCPGGQMQSGIAYKSSGTCALRPSHEMPSICTINIYGGNSPSPCPQAVAGQFCSNTEESGECGGGGYVYETMWQCCVPDSP